MEHTSVNIITATSFAPGFEFASEEHLHTASYRWFQELASVDAKEAVNLWVKYANLMNVEANAWLDSVGGLAMEKVQMEIELLIVADSAPNDLLFGLAFGKLTDAIAYRSAIRTPAHHVALTMGARTPVHNALYDRVLSRGHQLSLDQDEAESDDLFDLIDADMASAMPLGQSREDLSVLRAYLPQIKSPFMLGQLTSWILTNHRLNHPNQYAHLLSSSMMGGLSPELLADYCLSSTAQMAFDAETGAGSQVNPS